ncbi:MAG: acetate--CoA ligase family protein [Alphaproteobacteria bacterium]|nr:acetate--CoA ligase family protein [Alphaproteobacteria bacterium]
MNTDKVEALLNPRNIVMVGASDRPRHWSGRVRANLLRFGYEGGVYPVNPRRSDIWEATCYPDFSALPEPPDHVVSFVPADAVFGVLEEAAAAGARSALVFAGGFGEGGEAEGRARAARLAEVIAATGLAVCGPNCMGNVSAPSRAVTLPDDGLEKIEAGPTAVIAQSGGLCVALNRLLAERGLMPSYMVSAGNQVGLAAGDYLRFIAAQPQVKAVLLYLEQVVRADDFLAACREARAAGKAVVAVKIGGSDAGRAAALAHTGALVGSIDAFDAIAGAAGVVRLDSMEDAVEALEYLVRIKPPKGPGIAVMTNSGALTSLISEYAARAGVELAQLADETKAKIAAALGPLANPANPLDTRATVVTEAHTACMDALAADPGVDLLLMAEELPLKPGIERKELNLAAIGEWTKAGGPVPVAMFAPMALSLSDHAKALRAKLGHLPYMSEPDRTFRVLGRIIRGGQRAARAEGDDGPTAAPGDGAPRLKDLAEAAGDGPKPLDEVRSKALLGAFGLPLAREAFVNDAEAAAEASRDIGYPVVVKAVSAGLPHKSEAGAIALGLESAAAVEAACRTIADNVAAFDRDVAIDGFLVAEQVSRGAELALGLVRDPEMGPVVMFGSGGVMVELYADVAFGRPGLNRAEAAAMVDATRAGRILAGYRGAPALDREAVIDAIVAVGRFAREAGDRIAAVDVNPLIARPAGGGAAALDALVVLAAKG